MLVPLPAGAEVGLGIVPSAAQAVGGGLESVAIGGAEAVVVVSAYRVGAAAEVLVPVVVLGFPGGQPVVGRNLVMALRSCRSDRVIGSTRNTKASRFAAG